MTPSGSTLSSRTRSCRSFVRPLADRPGIEHGTEREARHREDVEVEQAKLAKVEHDLGNAASKERADGRVVVGPVRQDAHQSRDLDVDLMPVGDGRPWQTRFEGDRGDVEEEVR